MNAYAKTHSLIDRAARYGINLTFDQAHTLRRAELTLQRWAELECGDGNDYASWGIERDEKTDKPYMVRHPHNGPSRRWPIPDREAGALRRVAKLCADAGLYFYHQTDPRGCALYVSREPIDCQTYSRALHCSVN